MMDDDYGRNKPSDYIKAFVFLGAAVFIVIFSCAVSLPIGGWLSRALASDSQRHAMIVRQAEWNQKLLLLQDVGTWTLVALLVGGAGVILAVGMVKVQRNARLVYARDGVFPVERRRVGDGLWDRVRRAYCRRRGLPTAPVREVVIDHNLAASHMQVYLLTPEGMVFQASPDYLDERHRLAAVQGARQANNIQALMGGTTPLHRPTAGAMRAMLEARPPRPQGYEPELGNPDLPMLPVATPALVTDLARSPSPDDLLLGYELESGEPMFWNVQFDPGFCLFGAQRQGKTYIAIVVILSAIRNRWHVTIFDPEGGKDFSPYASAAEWHRTDPKIIVHQIRALLPEFERRQALLDEHNVGDFRSLPQAVQPPRTLLVFEEFKKMRASLDRGNLTEFDRVTGELATRGAKVGIYIMVLAQDKGNDQGGWPETIDVNLTGKATVRQGKKGYGNVGYFNAHKLAARQLGYKDQVLQAYEVAGRALTLTDRHPLPYRRLIPDSIESPSHVARNEPALGIEPGPAWMPEQAEPVDASLIWDDVVDGWFRAHPDTLEGEPSGINDLARTIAWADGATPDPAHPQGWPLDWRNKQSIASDYYHRRRGQYERGEWTPDGGEMPQGDDDRADGPEAWRRVSREVWGMIEEMGNDDLLDLIADTDNVDIRAAAMENLAGRRVKIEGKKRR